MVQYWSEHGPFIGKKLCPYLNIFDRILFNYWSQGENRPYLSFVDLDPPNLESLAEFIKWLITPCADTYMPFTKDGNLVYHYHVLLAYIAEYYKWSQL